MFDGIRQIIIGYGSESGNARMLATRLTEQAFIQPYTVKVMELNDILIESLGKEDILLSFLVLLVMVSHQQMLSYSLIGLTKLFS